MTIAPIVDTAPLGIGPQLGLVSIIGRNSVSTTALFVMFKTLVKNLCMEYKI